MPAADDELRHDDDPEETYGIVNADRTPKPAFAAVTAMFADRGARRTAREVGTAALSTMVVVAAGAWFWARRRHARQMAPSNDT